MKKNKALRIAALVLMLTLLSTCAISGTFAKYTSTGTANGTAKVAKWAFAFGADDIDLAEGTTGTTFDLSKDGMIAPGSNGTISVFVKNDSEVKAHADVTFTVTNASNLPIKFSTDGGTTWSYTIASAALDAVDEDLAVGASSDTQEIMWSWDFVTYKVTEAFSTYSVGDYIDATTYATLGANQAKCTNTDADDTAAAIAQTAYISVAATYTLTQIQ